MFARKRLIASLTQGLSVPSTRFRWKQYANDLENAGLKTSEFSAYFGAYAPMSKSMRPLWLTASFVEGFVRTLRASNSNVIFLQRNLIATLCTWEPLLKHPVVFDVDDAIFLGPRGAAADKIARHATITLCGNSFLADHFNRFGSVEIVHTAVDTDRFVPGPTNPERRIIGWSGTSSGFKYLESIQPALRIILSRYPDVLFKVVSDKPPTLSLLPSSQVLFVLWNPEAEVTALQDFTVGIMPLDDTLWERGKCSYKMLTYMAVGIPVVVSPVGMNVEVLAKGDCGYSAKSLDDWVEAVSCILDNQSSAARKGHTGREIVKAHYARSIIGPRIAKILKAQT